MEFTMGSRDNVIREGERILGCVTLPTHIQNCRQTHCAANLDKIARTHELKISLQTTIP